MRFVHFVSAFFMTFAFMVRVYWMFRRVHMPRGRFHPPQLGHVPDAELREAGACSGPHPAGAEEADRLCGAQRPGRPQLLCYFSSMVFQICTGFALYSPMSTSWLPQMFAWVTARMGVRRHNIVRLWHHTWTWVFVMFHYYSRVPLDLP